MLSVLQMAKKRIELEEVPNECMELLNVTVTSIFGYCNRSQGKGFI